MLLKDKFSKIDQVQFIRKRLNGTAITNNIKSYSIKNLAVEKNVKTSFNANDNNLNNFKKIQNQSKTSIYQDRSNNRQNISKDKNNSSYLSKEMTTYGYSLGTSDSSSAINLKHHPNQINNLIHNHKFYTSKTSNTTQTQNIVKNSKIVTSSRTEKSQRTQSLSPIIKNKYEYETRKVSIYGGKQRYSSASNSSGETNISITKLQLKKLMTNMWLEDIYCSNVESLCCLVENKNKNKDYYMTELHEKEIEIENNDNIIKEYEAEIIKLKSALNMKEQEMKKLMQNLKRSEKELKIKNKQIYELNIKTEKNKYDFDEDTHELQIISKKNEMKKNLNLDKDSHSLQILSMKKGWNETNIPSPINEIYIETVKLESEELSKKYEEKRRIMKRKEEEIIQKKLKKRIKLEIQEMGILSIISKKPKVNNSCQHLGSIMILSKEKKTPLISQKIEEIAILSHSIKIKNEIQELDGLEIINMRKKKELTLQEQCLNGLEIHRDYDMLLVKPVWDSLKIQGSALNLIAMKKEVELENQEIDEFEILSKKKPENIMEKINNFKITGKIKKIEFRINRERIKLLGIQKEEINWNEINVPTKSSKFLLKRNYDKIEPKIEINWDDIIRPIKSTKLFVKGKQPKVKIFKVAKRDKFNFLYSSPVKDEYDIENFNINLINSDTKIKTPLKMSKGGFKLKGKEKKKNVLIKNRMDSINLFGLKEKKILVPSLTEQIYLTSELELDLKNNWDDNNKIMKNKDLKILGKSKTKLKNIISKKVVNIEIKTSKKIVLNPIKAVKLVIKGIKKEVIEKPPLKLIKENRLLIKSVKKPEIILKQKKEMKLIIRGIKKEEPIIPDWNDINKLKKENSLKLIGKKKKVINWNELIKMEKKPSINFIHKVKKSSFKKQNLSSFIFKGIPHIEKKEEEKIKIINTWTSPIKAQRSAKFNINGKIKSTKLVISKCSKFMIKKEPEEEIIYNDDYNYLTQRKKENGKERDKLLVVKEKEITPIFHREIRAQVVKVKEDSSEASSQSEVDVLSGIKKQAMLSVASRRELTSSGFKKKILNGEVIFTPKTSLGVNLGGAKYKKDLLIKKRLNLYNKTHHASVSGIEISVNNGETLYEGMSGIGGTIKEGNYKIVNGSFSRDLNEDKSHKKLNTTIYQSSINIKRGNKVPNDSKKKNIKKQLIIKSRMKSENPNEFIKSGNMSNSRIITCENYNDSSKRIIYKSNLTNENIKHSSSSFGIIPGKSKIISMKKEQTYFYDHSDNKDLINKNQK